MDDVQKDCAFAGVRESRCCQPKGDCLVRVDLVLKRGGFVDAQTEG